MTSRFPNFCLNQLNTQDHNSNRRHTLSTPGLSAMRIHRLPEELAPPPPGQRSKEDATIAAGMVTGVRVPAFGHRLSLHSGASTLPGLDMVVDRPCTLLICFNDAAATTGNTNSPGIMDVGGEETLDLPVWATELGLFKTSMKVKGGDRRTFWSLWLLVTRAVRVLRAPCSVLRL